MPGQPTHARAAWGTHACTHKITPAQLSVIRVTRSPNLKVSPFTLTAQLRRAIHHSPLS